MKKLEVVGLILGTVEVVGAIAFHMWFRKQIMSKCNDMGILNEHGEVDDKKARKLFGETGLKMWKKQKEKTESE